MLSVDHVYCERSYLCDFNRESLQSREVVQTFNRTSLSDNAAYRVQGLGNPGKIQGRTQKYRVPCAPECQATRVKIIVLRYLNGMGSINIPTEDLLRHKVRIDADNFWHFSGFSYHSFSVNVKIIFRTNEKVQKNKYFIQLNIFDRSITISWHVLSSIQKSRQLFACGALAASISVGIVIPSTWFVYL